VKARARLRAWVWHWREPLWYALVCMVAALAYYHANRDEIEQDMAQEDEAAEQLEQSHS
jgi:hypothetical protein